MSTVRILSAKEIERLFRLDMAVAAVERAYRQKSEGAGQVWPMVFHEFQHGVADLDIKSGDLMAEQIFGLKVVSWFGENGEKNLPALFGTSLLFDRRTGEPKALLNAGPITGLRTGAAAAVGAEALARPESESLLMVGCGHQSPYLIAATLYVIPGIRRVQVANAKNPARAAEALPALAEKVAALLSACGAERDYTVTAAADLEAAVRESDVILTATPSYEPLIRAGWVRPGTHLSCIGADMSGKEELDPELFRTAKAFGDDAAQCFSVGECEKPHAAGILESLTEIGDVLTGKAPGRQSPTEITVFDSTGIALQDLASAAVILEKAEQEGAGLTAEL